MPLQTLRVGRWYLVANCPNCKTMIPVFRDLSNGQSRICGSYVLKCPRCRREGSYDVKHYQHHERRKSDIFIEIY